MAEVIARAAARRRGLGVEARSAGLMAGPGSPAAEHARELARERGHNLSPHRSAGVTPALLSEADFVLGMTQRHVDALRHAGPRGDVRIVTAFLPEGHPLRGASVQDPFGGDRAAYERTWDELEAAIEALMDHLARSGS